MSKLFTVESLNTHKTTRVRAESKEDAAFKGAIKLGIRDGGRKPTMVIRSSDQSSIYHTYRYLPECSASSNLYHSVLVTD
jgi:hypothetical protein